MTAAMIPLEVLKYKPLFALLYKIDLDVAEQTRAQHCPIAGTNSGTKFGDSIRNLFCCRKPEIDTMSPNSPNSTVQHRADYPSELF